jgi:hypothetical protein
MSAVYRLISRRGKTIGEANSIDELVEIARKAPPGHYRIDKLSLDPSTGKVKSWGWGEVTTSPDGRVELDLPPWID